MMNLYGELYNFMGNYNRGSLLTDINNYDTSITGYFHFLYYGYYEPDPNIRKVTIEGDNTAFDNFRTYLIGNYATLKAFIQATYNGTDLFANMGNPTSLDTDLRNHTDINDAVKTHLLYKLYNYYYTLSDQDKYNFVWDDLTLFVMENLYLYHPTILCNYLQTNFPIMQYMSMLQNQNGSSAMDGLWNTMVGSYGSHKAELTLSELDIYGSKRLGVIQDTTTLSRFHFSGTYNPSSGNYLVTGIYSPSYTATAPTNLASWYYGKKQFELTNHLGNVLGTLTDRKLPYNNTTGKLCFNPDVRTEHRFYSFGGKKDSAFSNGEFRYGFNGKPDDEETMYQDYGMRGYDSETGRFFSVDPIASGYPWYSPYQFAGNKPIWATDLDGKEESLATMQIESNCEDYLSGKINKDQFEKRQFSIGLGGVAGGIIVGGAYAGYATYLSAPTLITAISGSIAQYCLRNSQTIISIGGLTASIIDENPGSDYPGGLDDIGKGIKLLIKNKKVERFLLNSSKFDYFFGRVTSDKHNMERSLQNAKDLLTLGIDESKGGRNNLIKLFDEGLKGEIVKTTVNEHGTTITRRVLVKNGNVEGEINIPYLYKGSNMSATPEVTTIIPKIYKKK